MIRSITVAALYLCALSVEVLPAQSAATPKAVTVIGSEEMAGALARWNALFATRHPEISILASLKGSSTGISGLTAGVSAFAPMSREASEVDLRPFRFVYGYLPTDILVGHCGYTGAGREAPPAVYVHRRNPLRGLTAQQVAGIFTSGNAEGDLTQWGQVGLPVPFADRTIHVYGLRDDGGFASNFRALHMQGHSFQLRYEPLPNADAAMQALANDPFGIALIDEYDSHKLPATVRMLPLAAQPGTRFSSAGYDDVAQGLYPFSPYLHIYVNRAPNKPIAPWLTDYLRLVLSAEGQDVLSSAKGSSSCVVPLTTSELQEQVQKIDRLSQ